MKFSTLLLLSFFLFSSCKTSRVAQVSGEDGLIDFIFLQINDVYEIDALEGGNAGGMARVATLRHQLLKENPNTFTVLAGDFLNPSVMGFLKHEGKRIRGKQMVEVMNAIGVDLVVFGNHEFDIKEHELQERINESEFEWLGTNVLQVCGDRTYPFYRETSSGQQFIPESYSWSIQDQDGTAIDIGFFGATISSNPQDYVYYENHTTEALRTIKSLQQHNEVIIGLTHLSIQQDLALAKQLNAVPLMMGGHEHHHMRFEVGNTVITKADANAKSAYVHRLRHNTRTGHTTLKSELVFLNPSIALEPKTQSLVDKWMNIAYESCRKQGLSPNDVIATLQEPLDGRDSSNRSGQTNLGKLITDAMLFAAQTEVDAALQNSGSIRIDDQIQGQFTQFDLIRVLPFGGGMKEVEMTGDLLLKVLETGLTKKGKGGFLQWGNIKPDKQGKWQVNGKALDTKKSYTIALNDYLLAGDDIPFLTPDHPGIIKIHEPNKEDETDIRNDIRRVIVAYLKS